jgi:hypothetical protein
LELQSFSSGSFIRYVHLLRSRTVPFHPFILPTPASTNDLYPSLHHSFGICSPMEVSQLPCHLFIDITVQPITLLSLPGQDQVTYSIYRQCLYIGCTAAYPPHHRHIEDVPVTYRIDTFISAFFIRRILPIQNRTSTLAEHLPHFNFLNSDRSPILITSLLLL